MNTFTRRSTRTALMLLLGCLASGASNAQLTTGNVVVLQVGDGTAALGTASAPIFLKQYNKTTAGQAAPISSIALPTTGANARIVNSGSATSEGQITLSSDSSRLVIAGYDTTTGVATIATTQSASIARVIDTVSSLGIPGRAAFSNVIYAGGNFRTATRNNGENYWGAGSNVGTYYFGNTNPADTVQAVTANTRVILAANGNLYYTSSSGTPALYKISGQPATTATPSTLITVTSGTGTASPYGFAINSAESIVYIADDRTTANGGGIQKWTLSGTTWSLAYTLSTGTTAGARSVIADWSTSPVTLFAVSSATTSTLLKLIDSNATAAAVTLATAGTNTAFRSVAFAPKPFCVPPTAVITPASPVSFCQGASAVLRTNSTLGLTYTWTKNGSPVTGTDSFLTVSTAGTYAVTISAGAGCVTTSSPVTVNVNPLPTTSVTLLSSSTLCVGDSIRIRANSGAGYTYSWSVAGNPITGLHDSTVKIILSNTITSPAVFPIRAIITNAFNCTDSSAVINITANPRPPVPTASYNGTVLNTSGSYSAYQWYWNGIPVANGATPSYTPLANGNYSVMGYNIYGCGTMSPAITVTGLSVATLAAKGIRIYPNPATDVVNIDAPLNVTAVIKDVQGRTVQTTNNAKKVALSELINGIYSITLYTQSGELLGTQLLTIGNR